jgi:hypothetical protein
MQLPLAFLAIAGMNGHEYDRRGADPEAGRGRGM